MKSNQVRNDKGSNQSKSSDQKKDVITSSFKVVEVNNLVDTNNYQILHKIDNEITLLVGVF